MSLCNFEINQPLNVLFADGSFAGLGPQTAHLVKAERILFGLDSSLFDRLVVDGLEDGESCGDAVVLVASFP